MVFGGGKVIRDGMGSHPLAVRADEVPDLVITNVIVLDYTGIYKADMASETGKFLRLEKREIRLLMDGVDIMIGASTEMIAGEGKIIDCRRNRYTCSFH